MAAETSVKPIMTNGFDDDSDEDGPIVFKRNGSAPSSQNKSGANGQKSKMAPSTKASPEKSPLASPITSPSSGKSVMLKSSRPSTSSDFKPGQSSRQDLHTAVKEENHSSADGSQSKGDDEDSEDDKPLSYRLKGNSSQPRAEPSSSGRSIPRSLVRRISGQPTLGEVKKSVKTEDSDDEAPISSRLQVKSKIETLGNKHGSHNEKKPLDSKVRRNGFITKGNQQTSVSSGKRPLDKPKSVVSVKRPLDKGNSSVQSSCKKPKISDSPIPMKPKQVPVKEESDDDDDNVPIAKRMKSSASEAKSSSTKQKVTKVVSSSSKKMTKKFKKAMKGSKYSKSSKMLPSGDGQKKWTTLVHNGVIFPPPYKPHGIKIFYKGKPVDLTPAQEEVATMFAVMKDTDYYNKSKFRENFWSDWRKLLGKNHVIQSLDECNFDPVYEWHMKEKEKKKQMTSEEKKALKEEKLKQEEKYMWAIVDGVKEKVGNFRVEPPGLFRGRGEHPKMGKLKKRIYPSDITINIGKGAPIPECPIPGERWKEVRHDNTVTWLAFWNDPINPREFKYVFLAASSALKGQSDKEKYEKARKLKDYIKDIRSAYTKNFTSKDIMKRQIAVATYLIDKLALRAGNEKDDDEADTVGCCTLKVGNVECLPPNKLKFDFLGKDSIQYVNTVEVEPPVYKAIGQFQAGKEQSDLLFDQLDTSKLNAHLKELMPGLTAKVFRTYNASITLDDMLSKDTKDGEVAEKIAVYQHANKEVAIICNHQRTVSKTHGAQIERLSGKIEELKEVLKELKTDLDRARKGKPPLKDSEGKRKRNLTPEVLEKKIAQTNAKIDKMERDILTKEDLKTVALGTSKINYMDPRITVAWCKRHEVPIEKMFNKSLLAKFAWAMDVEPDFRF